MERITVSEEKLRFWPLPHTVFVDLTPLLPICVSTMQLPTTLENQKQFVLCFRGAAIAVLQCLFWSYSSRNFQPVLTSSSRIPIFSPESNWWAPSALSFSSGQTITLLIWQWLAYFFPSFWDEEGRWREGIGCRLKQPICTDPCMVVQHIS